MADLETVLLSSVLGFGHSRLDNYLKNQATDALSLLQSIVPTPSPAQKTAVVAVAAGVQTDLNSAQGSIASLATALAAPPQSLASAQTAFTHLADVLAALDRAVGKIAAAAGLGPAGNPLTTALQSAVRGAGDVVSGLAGQLGLAGAADSLSAGLHIGSPKTISFTLANAASRTIGGAGLTLSASSLTATLNYGASPPDLAIALAATVGVGLIADGFVQTLFGGGASGGAQATLKIGLGTAKGLTFGVGSKGRIDLPGSLSVPGIDLRGLALEVPPSGNELTFALTGTIAGSLGPIKAVVEGAGVKLTLTPGPGGALTASLGLRPPSGAGLQVDAGVVRGGGFVESKKGTYGGVLDLSLGPIEITAFGLLTPDPFSMVLVLSLRPTPPIQLSFGFTLNAVGGLLALERTVATDVLRQGIHDHTTDTLLFPKDPVASAPTLLDLLAAVFPVQRGGFVVGPLLELGWGAPVSYVTARLGVIISLPDPKVILMGSLRVALPVPEAALVDIRAEIYGEITPDHLLFLVSLSGNVAGFAMAGDFGVLVSYGAHPDFAFSAGGFHPHYPPPGELAGMRRVSVDLSPPALLTMRAEAYLALTANSFQLGCRVEVGGGVAGVGIEGHLAFDALVLWSPRFSFEIDLTAGVALSAFGETFCSVDLSLHLSGPGPWTAHGSASISLLFFDVTFDLPPITWGSGANPPAEAVSPQQLVADALNLPGAWSARLPADADTVLRLVDLGPDPKDVVVHPYGGLEVRQQAVPLETTIDRVGRNPVTVKRVNLAAPTVGGQSAQAVSTASDMFAPGEFLNLTDDQKLSRPGFESFPSGAVIAGSNAQKYGTVSQTAYQWDTVFPGSGLPKPPRQKMGFLSMKNVAAHVLGAGSAGKTFVANGNPYLVKPDPVILAAGSQTTIRSTRDLGVVVGAPIGPMTTTEAARTVAELNATAAANPNGGPKAQFVGPGVGA